MAWEYTKEELKWKEFKRELFKLNWNSKNWPKVKALWVKYGYMNEKGEYLL